MAKNNAQNPGQEEIKAENDFLKMKMMLERGAHFGTSPSCSPEMENEFLKQVMEFEEKAENAPRVTVFEKIGKPDHFKPLDQVPAEEIQETLDRLLDHMENHGVSLNVSSPNVSAAELYRFAVEELFQMTIMDLKIPGMVEGFIYDEYHPDHKYENIEKAVNGCLTILLSDEKFAFMEHFKSDGLRLNDHFPLGREEFKAIAYNWKKHIDRVEEQGIFDESCSIDGNHSIVTGQYKLNMLVHGEWVKLAGSWKVGLEYHTDYSFWEITEVWIEGISF